VVSYADVTLFVTVPLDIRIIREAIQCYERASGACLNTRKSKALAVGAWDNTTEVLDIPYYNEVQILGFSTASAVEMSAKTSWMKLIARTREQAWERTEENYAYPTEYAMYTHIYQKKFGTRHRSSLPPGSVYNS